MDCKIRLIWDSEAEIWVATSQDVPGLVLESESLDMLINKVRSAIPELIELNETKHKEYNLLYETERTDKVYVVRQIS